jgi:energy-coupling factor transporter ATP-binding protein EcfA2
MQLKSFRVRNFRSVDDSGPIETDAVTALIGINESGKSNLLLPLWKLNPAKDGDIKPTADYPRKSYNDIRNMDRKPDFIEATFAPDESLQAKLAKICSSSAEAFSEICVKRDFSDKIVVTFPNAPKTRQASRGRIAALLDAASKELQTLTPLKSEDDAANRARQAVSTAQASLTQSETVSRSALEDVVSLLPPIEGMAKTSAIGPRYAQLRADLDAIDDELGAELPNEIQEAIDLAWSDVPAFVYYTNYGNLDSEIYLPHVIQNMARNDLGAREQAKVRTLKVLFEFVGLKPEEILELGIDFKRPPSGREPTEEEIAAIAEKKKERSILLQSASTKLTQEFRSWWKQGEYRFRFEADGDHFRIWVSDDQRPEEVELEGRSTGLQWFLSFYLVFLVESQDAHAGAILLLDEPGTSLHPLAQRDLSAFFDGLSKSNQLIYTTHSPFLIDSDRLDRARKVYVASNGTTKATADLKESETDDKAQRASGYAVYAALGLTVAESLLLGCTVVIVEGLSDQIYLSAIKGLLIGMGKIQPNREIVFPPAGGAKGVKVVASILTARDEVLPFSLFDGDAIGKQAAQQLISSFYSDAKERVLDTDSFSGISSSEIEDLIPPDVIAQAYDRWQRVPDKDIADCLKAAVPIVPQIEAWSKANGVELIAPAWKVELAKRVKQSLLGKAGKNIPDEYVARWEALFKALEVG